MLDHCWPFNIGLGGEGRSDPFADLITIAHLKINTKCKLKVAHFHINQQNKVPDKNKK